MTFQQIRYFVKLAECLNFTEAAKCLFISQPALSRQISVMEEELGTALFIREKRRLKLTPGGSLLYSRLPQIMEAYTEAVTDACSANEGYEGTLAIGVLDMYDVTESVVERIGEFRKKNPNIRLTIERHSLERLLQGLYDGSLDFIMAYEFFLFDQPDLQKVPIEEFHSCVMLHKNHPLANQERLSLEDLKEETFIQLDADKNPAGREYLNKLCLRCGFRQKAYYVDKIEDVLLEVQTRNGVAIISSCSTEKYSPHVVTHDINIPEAQGHQVCIAWYKNNYNPSIAIFMDSISHT